MTFQRMGYSEDYEFTPREKWNYTGHDLGLTADRTSTDGWVTSWVRDDGLHLWRTSGGIQTAILENGRYAQHLMFEWTDEPSYLILTKANGRAI